MNLDRREFLQAAAASVAVGTWAASSKAEDAKAPAAIIDTHQHLWNLTTQKLPWLAGAPEKLKKDYTNKEYQEATAGLNIKAVYMEVNVAPEQQVAEAEHVISLAESAKHATVAAVISGQPSSDDFEKYIRRFSVNPYIKGVRRVLHDPEIKQGTCLEKNFVGNMRLLGALGLSFDLCMRPRELSDGVKLAQQCPDTRFIVDHCGNADPKAFLKTPGNVEPTHEADPWKRDMEAFAKLPNVICKISGIVVRAPQDWSPETLAPVVNFCLDTFGPDRVVFGSDWPVCLLNAELLAWVSALQQIVSARPAEQQTKLWHDNAHRLYALKG